MNIDELDGFPDSHDRRWLIEIGGTKYPFTDYNWEITGFDPRLHVIAPDIFEYGGNAYYITGSYAEKYGYKIEEIHRGNV